MFEIKLITPDSPLIDFYNNLWKGTELQSYETSLLCYGEADTTMEKITINDIRPLVYEYSKDDGTYKNTDFKNGDKKIDDAIKKAEKNNSFSDVVTKINAIYHTRTSRSVVDTLNSNWNDISEKIAKARSEKDIVKSRVKRNEIIDIIADGNGKANRYSFATKFCSFVSQDLFPIFDSVSSTLLYAYLRDSGYTINRDYLGLYRYYLEAYDTFIDEFNLQGKTYKEIDKFLWLYGTAISKSAQSTCLVEFSSPKYISKENTESTVTKAITKNVSEN